MDKETIDQTLQVVAAIYDWIFAWQTLVGALIALVAALWTIGVMRDQANAEAVRHHEAQRRKRLAARAQMPDALSELGVYVRGCAARLVGQADVLPPEPASAIAALKEVIEFIDDAAAQRTFELVSWYQVLRARMSHDIPTTAKADFHDRQWDVVLLQAYINSLFDYARNESDSVKGSKPSLEEMTDAMKNAFTLIHYVQHEDSYTRLLELIAKRSQSVSPSAS